MINKKLAILVANLYQELEVWYPLLRLQEAGAKVICVGLKQGETYHSKYGYPVVADRAVHEVKAEDLDGVIIPGGYAPDIIRRYDAMNQLVREVFQQGKLVSAICHAGWVLASAGILKGKKATSFFAIKDDMVHAGAEFVDQEVVRDGNLITSRKPEDLPAFCREILAFLQEN